MRLQLLTTFELRYEDTAIALPLASQRVLGFLALRPGLLQRSYVAGQLWPGSTDAHAHASLRSAVWRLRQCEATLVEATHRCIALAPHVTVDVREQIALAKALLDPSTDLEDRDYIGELAGELLPDWYDEWVLLEREHVRQLRLHALEALAEKLRERQRYGEAVEAAQEVLRTDPLRESAHRSLISTYLAEGNRWEAVCQFRACEELLQRRLGVEPMSELVELIGGLVRRTAVDDR